MVHHAGKPNISLARSPDKVTIGRKPVVWQTKKGRQETHLRNATASYAGVMLKIYEKTRIPKNLESCKMMFSVSKVMFAVDVGRNLDITSPSERPHPVHDLAVTGLVSMDWWCATLRNLHDGVTQNLGHLGF